MKVLLVCNAGMSTSMLVARMKKAADDKGIDLEVIALPLTQAEKQLDDWDCVMLGPQVRHCLPKLKNLGSKTPIAVIEMKDYGMMNGQKVLEAAMKLIEG